ncbi:MAG: hypothetical protein VCB25_03810 [Myxococcota bacterium]
MMNRGPMKRALLALGAVVAPLAAWLIVLSPSIAAACSVCTAGRDEENAAAFLITTIFMSVLPLLAIGTLVYVLWRRVRKLEADAASTRDLSS